MSDLTVKIEGVDELKRAFRKSPQITSDFLNKAIQKAIFVLQGAAVPITPIDQGHLRGSFRPTFKNLEGVLANTAKYAIFVHEGTAKWPVSVPPKNPNTVRQFFTEAIDSTDKEVQNIFKSALDSITFKLATI